MQVANSQAATSTERMPEGHGCGPTNRAVADYELMRVKPCCQALLSTNCLEQEKLWWQRDGIAHT